MDLEALRSANPDHWSKATAIRALTLDAVAAAIREERPLFAFVDGPGGSGKTFLYETLL